MGVVSDVIGIVCYRTGNFIYVNEVVPNEFGNFIHGNGIVRNGNDIFDYIYSIVFQLIRIVD